MTKLKEENEEASEQVSTLESQLSALKEANRQVVQHSKELEEKLESSKGGRASLTSEGDDYSSVEDMREHLKVAR